MFCKELNKEFESKELMFAELKANKSMIIDEKKATIKTSEDNLLGFYNKKTGAIKGIPDMDDDFIYAVISNTNFIDSHKDVHMDGSMTKTAKEQNRKVYYVADHELKVDNIIATPKNVEIVLIKLDWKDLGKEFEGKTEAFIFKIEKTKIVHKKFKQLIDSGESLQNSIRMQYLKIEMAVNSEDEELKEEYKTYLKVYPKIANKEQIDKDGYFFAIMELKIILEGSAVLFGSNDATPTKIREAVNNDTSLDEPPKGTQQKSIHEMLSKVSLI